jgi:hypothetical protein
VHDRTPPSALRGLVFDDYWIMVLSHGNPSGLVGSRTLRSANRGAVGAQAPVDNLGLVDREAEIIRGGQAGCLADRAVNVGDDTA